jgi:formylglycine-generating enzyme required for sulfatase activity/serine/threonine protein kinase
VLESGAVAPPQDPLRPEPPSLQASLSESQDASGQILRRLAEHGAKQSRYLSRGEIARGGMGLILRVWDEDLRRELAMKVVLGESGQATTAEVPPKVLGRFLEEAQVTGQLDHPGIVPVHEMGLDERGAVFFTMRLVRGRDLKEIFDVVQRGDPDWTLTRVLWVLLKVCDAMAYAHSKGVIHRDLKPANVMVGRFGEVYVMDWGLARVLGQPDRHDLRLRREESGLSYVQSERRADASHSADSVLFTMDGDVVGTPAYMAPEQARGEIERLGPRSDVYSLGAMLYHLLAGEMPYVQPGTRVSQHMVLRWALEGPPRPVHALRPDVPEELVAICEKAMARAPEQRYADMGALADDLRAYLENRVVQAHRRGAWIELRKWIQRNRALALAWSAAIVVALVGLGTTLFVQVRGRRAANEAMRLAQASERRANENLAEAERQREIARRERSNVLRLSAFQELADLEDAAGSLWPALPAREPELRAWLAHAERLSAGLEPGKDGDPGHRRQLADLRARAVPISSEERARALESARGADLGRAEREVAVLRTAGLVRAGRARPEEVALDPSVASLDAVALNERAYPLVAPTRAEFGREAEGLALARAAVAGSPEPGRFLALDTLAWAQFACGLDEEALETSRTALAEAPRGAEADYEQHLERLAQAVELARGPSAGAALAAARARLARLEAEVLGARLPRFEREDDRWWHGQLEELVEALEAFADPAHGLVRGLSPRHGWGVERRLAFALALEERTRTGPEARARWAAAIAEVRDPARSPGYAGLELVPQLGLLPLGADPRSGLQEFADVATGEPPLRRTDGSLELLDGSSVVFVLLPGGTALLGAQHRDRGRPRFDPEAADDEGPVHTVRLAPFFLAKHELTQGQWRRFTARAPSKYLSGTSVRGRALGERSPLERVSWLEAERELARLGWRLPTEAQWEYAARAGSETPWWTGGEVAALGGAANLADRFAREHGAPWTALEEELDDGHYAHAPVGSFEPNPFGLHDVIGNVYEWCRDEWSDYSSPAEPVDGLRLGGTPATRVVRGGSYVSAARGARSSKRDSAPPELENEAIGIRAMRALEH